MSEEKKKEGVSVGEIENYAKRHRFELFFCLLFILATLFSLVFWGSVISLFSAGAGGIIGVLLTGKANQFCERGLEFVFKQEKTTQLLLGIVSLIIAIFVAPLVFLVTGFYGGMGLANHCRESQGKMPL